MPGVSTMEMPFSTWELVPEHWNLKKKSFNWKPEIRDSELHLFRNTEIQTQNSTCLKRHFQTCSKAWTVSWGPPGVNCDSKFQILQNAFKLTTRAFPGTMPSVSACITAMNLNHELVEDAEGDVQKFTNWLKMMKWSVQKFVNWLKMMKRPKIHILLKLTCLLLALVLFWCQGSPGLWRRLKKQRVFNC